MISRTYNTTSLPGNAKYLIAIAGPTAVGKTALAVALAQKYHTAVISADSRQCYREMNIGTARPAASELEAVKHYFINTHSVTEALTAGDFERLALGYLEEIYARHPVAVLCGGTGLYIKALCEGIDEMPAVDNVILQQLQAAYQQEGRSWLQRAVAEEDPVFYASGETENPARMLRALSFKRSTGRSIMEFRSHTAKERPFRVIKLALTLPRPDLYRRIDLRVDKMMEAGLLEEVASLRPYRHLKNLHTVGYTELFDFLENKTTLEEAVLRIKQRTRNYAKRQLTWLRKDPEWKWLAPDQQEAAFRYIESFFRLADSAPLS